MIPQESRRFVPRVALSRLLTGTLQPRISFGLNIQGLAGGNHIQPMYFGPKTCSGTEPGNTLALHLCNTCPCWVHPGLYHCKKEQGSTIPRANDSSCYLGLIAFCSSRGGPWGLQQWLENRLWKERLTC